MFFGFSFLTGTSVGPQFKKNHHNRCIHLIYSAFYPNFNRRHTRDGTRTLENSINTFLMYEKKLIKRKCVYVRFTIHITIILYTYYQYISNYSPLNFFFKIIKSKTTKNKGFIEVQMTDKMIFKNLNGI